MKKSDVPDAADMHDYMAQIRKLEGLNKCRLADWREKER
jgi:hypothetical protein